MNYAEIKYFDIANGPGVRTTLFVSGCTHHCKNCFQPQTWDFNYGRPFTQDTENEIIKSLQDPNVSGLTLLGGEPLEPENVSALVPFIERLKQECPDKTVWCFTGDVLEELYHSPRCTDDTIKLLNLIDVLVDGPFIQDLYDISLRFRGSSNQRMIDMNKSKNENKIILWEDKPLFQNHLLCD